MAGKKRVIYPIQLDSELDEKIALAAEKLSMPKAEVMRLAMAIGLEHFRRIDYNLAAHLCQTQEPFAALKVAEDAGNSPSLSTPAPGAAPVKYPAARRRKL